MDQSQDTVKSCPVGLWEKERAELEGINRGRLPVFDETCRVQSIIAGEEGRNGERER